MGIRLSILASVVLIICGAGLVGCKKKAVAQVDPHSSQGVMLRMQEQGRLLADALARKDYAYIHNYAYYFNGLTQAFYSKLDEGQRQRFSQALQELNNIANELDHSAGRKHAEATEAGLQRLQVVLKDLDKQFRENKQSG